MLNDDRYSDYGRKLAAHSGINQLMDDLSRVLDGSRDSIMMGGGNPALIPAVAAVWRRRFEEILRISYVQPPDVVRRGVQVLAEEIGRAYGRTPDSSPRRRREHREDSE